MVRSDKRQQIMKAGERLFTSRQFDEIKMDDVARAARVGKGTIYQHFRDKNDLFFQIATSGFDELCQLLRERVSSQESFERQLLDACLEIAHFFEARRQLFRLMQAEGARMAWCRGSLREHWTEKRRGLVAAVAAVLAKGADEGSIRRDIPPDVLAVLLLGMLHARARDLADAREEFRRLDLVIDLFCRGAQSLPAPHSAIKNKPATTKEAR